MVQGKEWLGSGVQKQIKRRTQPRDAAFHLLPEHVHTRYLFFIEVVSKNTAVQRDDELLRVCCKKV